MGCVCSKTEEANMQITLVAKLSEDQEGDENTVGL
jgi:hypothetical protein